MNRKEFIKTGSLAGALLALGETDLLAAQPSTALLLLATNWGFEGTVQQFCEAAAKDGYDGIELWWPTEKKDQDALVTALRATGLKAGFLCGGYEANPMQHLATFKSALDAATGHAQLQPLYINCHSGRDWFSEEANSKFIEYTITKQTATGVPIYHETHRSRILFAAHIARRYMDKFPELNLTLDISHWCNVHESMLNDQPETVQLALQRAAHIHARVGHPEGPQVNDPRAPEWEKIVAQHLSWWDQVVTMRRAKGERITILTEFGPPDYMPAAPYTRKSLADQWAVNVYMMQLLRKRYS
ncbi:MAG: TIM barrel protein [Flavihumibacter sp.]